MRVIAATLGVTGMSWRQNLCGAAVGLVITFATGCATVADSDIDRVLKRIKLPPGFEISLFARVPGARTMVIAKPLGAVFVGSRRYSLHLVIDRDNDGVADQIILKSERLKAPNGLAHDGKHLYVAEQHRVIRWSPPSASDPNQPFDSFVEPVMTGLPDNGHHGWRYAAFGPDGKLYVSIGSPCNVCQPNGFEGTIIRMDRNGGNLETVARGIRNSVGFDWHPRTNELFFTDNGSDGLGDDIPADELNHVTRAGQHFGFPWYGGGRTRTPEFSVDPLPDGLTAPAIEFAAHTASLGIHFYRGRMFPPAYRHDAFVAQHGSWNRSSKIGYRIMRVRFDDRGKAIGKEVFAAGWLDGRRTYGRPVDITELADGSLLVSDDAQGAIYRINYSGG
jgi:glucose/arabinose dehydrogenase